MAARALRGGDRSLVARVTGHSFDCKSMKFPTEEQTIDPTVERALESAVRRFLEMLAYQQLQLDADRRRLLSEDDY